MWGSQQQPTTNYPTPATNYNRFIVHSVYLLRHTRGYAGSCSRAQHSTTFVCAYMCGAIAKSRTCNICNFRHWFACNATTSVKRSTKPPMKPQSMRQWSVSLARQAANQRVPLHPTIHLHRSSQAFTEMQLHTYTHIHIHICKCAPSCKCLCELVHTHVSHFHVEVC